MFWKFWEKKKKNNKKCWSAGSLKIRYLFWKINSKLKNQMGKGEKKKVNKVTTLGSFYQIILNWNSVFHSVRVSVGQEWPTEIGKNTHTAKISQKKWDNNSHSVKVLFYLFSPIKSRKKSESSSHWWCILCDSIHIILLWTHKKLSHT